VRERIAQLRQAWEMTSQQDPRLALLVFGPAAATLVAFVVVGIVAGSWLWFVIAVLAAMTVGLVMFGRRAQSAQYSAIEGQPGAAAAVLNVMRGQWFVSPAIAFNKKQDMVHRVVGRCGIVLVGEGSRNGVKQLLAQERKRLKRISGDVTIHTIVVGDGEGEVSISGLQVAMTKLPRELKKTEVPKLERRLKPMDRDLPMPKGYMPNPGKKMR
jgi:hypothetical protein